MKPLLRLALLAAAVVAALLVGVRLGAVPLGVGEIVDAVRGLGDPTTVTIVRELRLPRSLQAALVGAALAASGATFQALLRNPLAEPYVLGVSGGAAVGAVLAVVAGFLPSALTVSAAAFAGAIAAILLVFRIAATAGRALDTRILLLAGVVAGAFFNAVILLALTFADAESFRSAVFWMMGSFSGATWAGDGVLAIAVAAGLAVLFALARPLNLLAVGEETAAYLGTRVERTKVVALGTASLLTAVAVAAAGVIGFVGLAAPHLVRRGVGDDPQAALAPSAIAGAVLLVAADLLSRMLPTEQELKLGVVTALFGAPLFALVAWRAARSWRT